MRDKAAIPPVAVRSVVANGKPYPWSEGAVLPPLTRRLNIGYAVLSLSIPERVRARYKLEGAESDWQDAGNRRDASYNNLGPGTYTFRVIGSNNDGVWNETGASWRFEIKPAFYQTAWFHALYGLAGAAMIWLLYRFRLRQMTARVNLRYNERLAERTRIARELHDTLLQSFHGLMFRFQAARNMLPRRPEEAIQALDEALERTEQALTEGRDAIHDLRATTAATNELAQALTAMGPEMSSEVSHEPSSQESGHGPARFHVVVEGSPRGLNPILRDEVYAIAREAVRNAFRHAQARNIEVDITYRGNSFRLRIRDDGKGIDPRILTEGRAGHYGVPGMQERARRLGGKLDVWTGTGAGTEIELSIPTSIAYRPFPRRTVLGLFRRKAGNGPLKREIGES